MADIISNYVKFLRGSIDNYNNLATKDADTLYFVTEDYIDENSNVVGTKTGKLYLGTTLIAGAVTADGDELIRTLGDLENVITNGAGNLQYLGYDSASGNWKPMSISDVVKVMVGATATKAGESGLVPAPAAGDQNKFLKGDGTWAEIPSGTQVFADIVPAEGQSHADAIAAAVSGKQIQAGDVAVVKEVIYNDKYELTAYVYDGENWTALSGNYNAENVYFDEDITITMQVGNATVTNGAGVIPSKGKNLKQVFEALYAKEDKTLTIDWPSVSFTLSSNVDAEVGTTFTRPTATLKVTDIGSYEYGSLDSAGAEKAKSTTGVTFNKMKVAFGTNNAATTSMNEITAGSYGVNQTVAYTASATDIASNTVTDAAQSYSFCYITDHTASPYKPRTNLGNLIKTGSWTNSNTKTELKGTAVTDISGFADALGALEAKTLNSSASFSVTGYRKWFTYVGDNLETIDSAWVRTKMTDKGKGKNVSYTAAAPLSLTVPGGTKRVVIALPTGKVGTTTHADYAKRVTSCIDVDGMGLDIFASGKFAQSTVDVNDASGANPMEYIVYVYENANGLAATTLKFAIG